MTYSCTVQSKFKTVINHSNILPALKSLSNIAFLPTKYLVKVQETKRILFKQYLNKTIKMYPSDPHNDTIFIRYEIGEERSMTRQKQL